MEGIPAPDVADYKRRKEIELGLTIGSISQPQSKRPKIENRVFTQAELRIQLEAHKALMGAAEIGPIIQPIDPNAAAVYNAEPQAYAAPPMSLQGPPGSLPGMPPVPFPPQALRGYRHFYQECRSQGELSISYSRAELIPPF